MNFDHLFVRIGLLMLARAILQAGKTPNPVYHALFFATCNTATIVMFKRNSV